MTGKASEETRKVAIGIHVWAVLLCLAIVAPVQSLSARAGGMPTTGSPAAAEVTQGKTIFHIYCSPCHTIGHGVKRGPDLKGVTALRTHQWLERWIRGPDKMLAEKDPIAVALRKKFRLQMPNLRLTREQVTDVISFLGVAGASGISGAPIVRASAGNAVAGRNLFTGEVRFQNGGPACISCHSINGIGAFGGGTMGPDLTPVYRKLRGAAVSWPQTVAPMRPIFSVHPLTIHEKANLAAFLKHASLAKSAPSEIVNLAVITGIGALLLLIVMHLFWRRRLSRGGGVRWAVVKRR